MGNWDFGILLIIFNPIPFYAIIYLGFNTMLRIILGTLGLAIGFLIVWKSEWILQNFGTVAWAEAKLGTSGGSRFFYKLIGLSIIIISILYLTGLIEGVILAIFSRLFIRG